MKFSMISLSAAILISTACEPAVGSAGDDGKDGATGSPGAPGDPGSNGSGCTVNANSDGSATVSCTDGSTATIEPGDDGPPLLTRTVPFPPDGECSAGGERVEGGLDDNRNGVLDDDEVDSILVAICAAELTLFDLQGDATIADELDLIALQSVRSIAGDLVVTSPDLQAIVAPNLIAVNGTIDVSGAQRLTTIELTALEHMGALRTANGGGGLPFVSAARALTRISFPAVVEVGSIEAGSVFNAETVPLQVLDIQNISSIDNLRIVNTRLTQASFPRLQTAGGLFFIAANTIETIDLGQLIALDRLSINQGDALTSLTGLGQVSNALAIELQGAAISTLDAGSLTAVNRLFLQNTNLTSLVGFARVVAVNTLTVLSNPQLTSLQMASLRVVSGDGIGAIDDLEITGNAALPDCQVAQLVAQLTTLNGSSDTSQNGGGGACP